MKEPIKGASWKHFNRSQQSEFLAFAQRQGYHPLDVEDCFHDRQNSKVIERPEYVFAIAKIVERNLSTGAISFHDFNVFIKRDLVVTLDGDSDLVKRVCERFAEPGVKKDVGHLVHAMLDEVLEEYLEAVDRIGEITTTLEEQIWKEPSPESVQKIFQLKEELIDFRRHSSGMREIVSALVRHPHLKIEGELEYYYRDLYDHAIRSIEFVETYRDVLTGLFDVYLSSVANRTNEIMKVLTIYGIIVLPLMVIPGIYGMNVPIPFQTAHDAFDLILIAITLLTGGLLALVKRKGWI